MIDKRNRLDESLTIRKEVEPDLSKLGICPKTGHVVPTEQMPTIKPDGHNDRATETVWVKIPADLSSTSKVKWKQCRIDSPVAGLVNALQLNGIDMRGSCCGHGKQFGEIHLQDGRLLLVLSPDQAREYLMGQTRKKRWVLKLEDA